MSESLFKQLKDIGIDEELACKVSASLDPDYNASKKDVLVMQEAMLQLQARSDQRFNHFEERLGQFTVKMAEQDAKSDKLYNELKTEMIQGFAEVRSEMHTMNRQFIFAFGGMVVTILSVLAINIYFH